MKTDLSHVQLMGILNLTPDSFSDGGNLKNEADITIRASEMIKAGASILDIGGESTGPGSTDVTAEEELDRVIPALKAVMTVAKTTNTLISIDTWKSEVAELCLQMGADMINDITGLRGDQKMAETVAKHNAKVVIMYSKDQTARTTKEALDYDDVMETIKDFFDERIQFTKEAGIPYDNIILDPGMGAFVSSNPKYSFEILERLEELDIYDLPILIGTSRKSMHPQPLEDRLIPSISTALLGAFNGADILRVHDVKEHQLAIKTFQNL
jgi:dihydropteroate synthase